MIIGVFTKTDLSMNAQYTTLNMTTSYRTARFFILYDYADYYIILLLFANPMLLWKNNIVFGILFS